ncbi:MAG: hypothetical protein V1743_06660 [Nanoarchaeota archaeon]
MVWRNSVLIQVQIMSDSSVVISGSFVVGRGGAGTGSLWDLKKHEIEEAIAKLSLVMRKKYPKKKETKYGSINKGFTDEELALFLGACRNEKDDSHSP